MYHFAINFSATGYCNLGEVRPSLPKSLDIMTSSFSFGAKITYFIFSGSGFSSDVGGSCIEGANLVGLASALQPAKNLVQ